MATSVEEEDQTFGSHDAGHWSWGRLKRRIAARWRKIGLSAQFLLSVGIAMIAFFAIDSTFQSWWIRSNVVDGNARIASIYMRAIIAPHVQELATAPSLSVRSQSALDRSLAESGLMSEIEVVKVWRLDGTVVYSTEPDVIGRRFDSSNVENAAKGEVVISYEDAGPAHSGEEASEAPLLEIYMPIFGNTGNVIAVGEFYQDLEGANADLMSIIRGSWLIRLPVTAAIIFVLFLLVRNAHKLILDQEMRLRRNYATARRLAARSRLFQTAAEDARRKAARSNEDLLSRVGSEIHDGPMQLLSLAMLKSGGRSAPQASASGRATDFVSLTASAIDQLRDISTGLILPEIEELSLEEALRLAIARHEKTTGTNVVTDIADLPDTMSHELKACLYRIVQELLNNSSRHADGVGQRVSARQADRAIVVVVSDTGPGMREASATELRPRLGLVGAKLRVDAFGGTLHIESVEGVGTEVCVTIPVERNSVVSS